MKKLIQLGIIVFGLSVNSQNPSNLDTTFGVGGKVFTDFNPSYNQKINTILVQPDGKILAAGSGVVNVNNSFDFLVTRYNADGTLDTSFGTNGKANFEITNFSNKQDFANGMALQTDGKILICGYSPYSNFSSNEEFSIIRLNPNGTLDQTYAVNGILRTDFGTTRSQANAITIQPDNKAVVVGFTADSNSLSDFAVVRINSDGTLDTDFSNDGKQVISLDTYDKANAVNIQSDGKIVISGVAGQNKIGIIRLNEFGNLDSTFGASGKVITSMTTLTDFTVKTAVIQIDGKIIVGGTINGPDNNDNFLLARYNINGTLDSSFGTSGITSTDLDNSSGDVGGGVALQSNGKIVLTGSCSSNGTNYFGVTRFTNNGFLDTTFSGDGIQLTTMNSSTPNTLCIQDDGKIIVGGGGISFGNGDFAVARYLGDSFLKTDDFNFNKFDFYPNPVKNVIQINIFDKDLIGNKYQIIDLNGRIVFNGKLVSETNQINVENLLNGLYIFKINNINKKFIKQ